MKVAVFGCLHGMLEEMYKEVEKVEERDKIKIDLIIVCGDCQTLRHRDDLCCLQVPNKYKKLGDFYHYYSGARTIPKLTIFVGGNHEASNYLMTLPYGGWVCDNFYYLGNAGVVQYKGLRIAGVSGIYNKFNCGRGRFETLPLDDSALRSVYHTRKLDIFRLQLLSRNVGDNPIDVFISHDWPRLIYEHGNKEQLMRFKPFFRKDIESKDGLGSPLTEPLVTQLKPGKWFAAHLHCRFEAKVNHGNKCTEFLALSKIETQRNFMDIVDLVDPKTESDSKDSELYYDPEWLTILRKTHNLDERTRNDLDLPTIETYLGRSYIPAPEEIKETTKMMNESGGLVIKRNFRMVEPIIYNRPNSVPPSLDPTCSRNYPNYQTEELYSRLQLEQESKPGKVVKFIKFNEDEDDGDGKGDEGKTKIET